MSGVKMRDRRRGLFFYMDHPVLERLVSYMLSLKSEH
jgi:hypothetical protein